MIIDSRYKVLKKLGSGLWATVYQVQDLRTNEIYALKLFQMLDAEALYDKFSAENMHHITKLEHPNLIHVSDFGNFGKHIYYLSEFYDGKTLSSFRFTKSSLDLFYDIIVQICYALSALHSQNIIHHDLKPENVVYRIEKNKAVVKVMDYGFTKIDVERRSQKVGKVLPYIAPEIYMGKGAVTQSDFYSLGAILYKLTTGSLPYTVEQISAIMAGDHYNIFPKFPRELNPDIPEGLERLILKLLEKDPESRYENVESIITQINAIQLTKFPFSRRWSIVNTIQFSDYIVREDYSQQLLDYVPIVENGNGKIISLSAGKGLGKNNVLTLFRYHLLTDRYFIFDYECSEKHVDPFFALIKEFTKAAVNNQHLASDLKHISKKLQEYLYESEETATQIVQDKRDLELDFQSAIGFVTHLSETKPLIYIIRSVEHLPKEVFEFVNFVTRVVSQKPIMIILSTNDPRKLEGLIHSVKVKIEPLDLEQTRVYVNRLLRKDPPEEFIKTIWERSMGNPLFIETILIDLIKKGKLWVSNNFKFNLNFARYKLPSELQENVNNRIAHLSEKSYKYFITISSIQTPLANDILKFVLNIDDKELFFFLLEGLDNELLRKVDDFYMITFKEVKDHFVSKSTKKIRNHVSHKLIKFFENIAITIIPVAEGIIKHAESIGDYFSVRKYYMLLEKLYSEETEYHMAFDYICKVVDLDLSKKIEIKEVDLRNDMKMMLDRSEWTTISQVPDTLKKSIMKMPEITEKYLIVGTFYQVAEKYHLAQLRFEKGLKLAITGYNRMLVALRLSYNYFMQSKWEKMKEVLDEVEKYKPVDELKIEYITCKSLYLGYNGGLEEGIQLIEDFLPTMKSDNKPNNFIRLGNLHNTLGLLYHIKKMLNEAEKNFEIARKVWEKVDYKRKLGIIYNNIGDIALIRGDTNRAFEFFRRALDVCTQVECKRVKVQGLLNHAEAFIKLGNFNIAEKYLKDSLALSKKLETKPFLSSIINNQAIAKSKINNFAYYLNFINENVPSICQGSLYKITPLTKTYFYYLHEIGDYNKIENMLSMHEDVFLEHKEHEFYHQMFGFLYLHKKDYKKALENIDLAFQYSKQNSSEYALTINYLRMVQCYLGLQDYKNAYDLCQRAEMLCEKHNFRYWESVLELNKLKVQLLDEKVSFRPILRKLYELISYVQNNHLFLIEIEIYELLVQIYSHLKINKEAEKYFAIFKTKVSKAVEGISEYDQASFLKNKQFYLKDFRGLKTVMIKPRVNLDSDKWQEELYDILKLRELDRMKFLVEKTIKKLFSPSCFAIILKDEIEKHLNPFLSINFDLEKLYSKRYLKSIHTCLTQNKMLQRKIEHAHVLFVPLRIKTVEVGCIVMTDSGEIPFQPEEISILKILRLHLTSILVRIKEFATLNRDMDLMSKLVEITRSFFSILNVNRLEQEVVTFALDFTDGNRGFLIKKDKFENYVYKVALDDSKRLLKNYVYISKTILSEVQQLKQPIFVDNVRDDKLFDSYIDHSGKSFSVYCAPIIVDGDIHGYLYLDSYNSSKGKMSVNPEFMRLLLTQISVALKNAIQYESLMYKNQEISSLDTIKKDFINIASHELNTPLTGMQGYLGKLRQNKHSDADTEYIENINEGVNKIRNVVNDLLNFNKYLISGELRKSKVSAAPILNSLIEEGEKISADRHMQFRLELEDNLPEINLNIEAFQLLIYNIVINAIRFTKDFGTIIVGARRSTFQQEEINGKESVVIYVQDNGVGIPEHELSRVFQKFYELSDIISHKSGSIEFKSSGLGLGLSVVQQITDLHNGKVWINSKENDGTTVFVALPI
jgi:signal transduction histidine kinase/serine/threonine protein kinase